MPSSPFRPSSPFQRSASPFRRSSSPLPPERKEKSPQPQRKDLGFGEKWSPGARPSLSMSGKPEDPPRRQSSVQFNTAPAEDTIRRESLVPKISNTSTMSSASRRLSSPPPPRTYQRGVSFDTFDNRDATDFSLTLNYKHKDYQSSRRSRTFLCGTDQKDYSDFALEWLIDELVDDGDEVVCLRVVEKDSKIASDASIEQGKYRQEAQKLLDQVIEKNSQEEKAISMIMELAVGRVQDIIQRMIQIYEPAVLIVGTRGRSLGGVQGLLPGSVSKYCLQSSPIPVIVVRPSTKRLKKKQKRMLDPNRRGYNTILEQATTSGSHLDINNSTSTFGPLPVATDDEAAAVARAIGIPKDFQKPKYTGRVARAMSNKSDHSDEGDEEEPKAGFLPAGYLRTLSPDPMQRATKSPTWAALDESNDDISDDEDKLLSPEKADDGQGEGSKKPHAPSFSENPPWLKAILAKPDPLPRRRPSSSSGL